jgi:cobalt-zinc-cadmium efflux system protein
MKHDHCSHDQSEKHSHDHHGHNHGPVSYTQAFAVGILLNFAFVLIEAGYGYASHSLALMADAGHNLSDVLGLILAWGATYLATKKPSRKFTYGFRSSSILAALGNAVFLLIAIGGIAWEAIGRFNDPHPVGAATVMIVAGIGIVINGATALLFMSGRKSDLNLKGAYLHMLSDALVSAGVVVAGFAISLTGLNWIDPVVSLVISAVIVWGTWGLLRDSVKLALNAVPESIDGDMVLSYLRALPDVTEVHDLHIWAMSTTETALTAHLIMKTGHPGDKFLKNLSHHLEHNFEIHHVTVQIEMGEAGFACSLAPDEVV